MNHDPETPHAVGILAATPELQARAEELAQRYGLPLETGDAWETALVLTAERLELRFRGADAPGPVYVDFVGGRAGHRRRFGGGRGQPIAKAVGLKSGANPYVIDATAGLGRDAFVLASLGSRVTLLERSAVAAALLEDGLVRAARDPDAAEVVARMTLRRGDAVESLAAMDETERPDVIYLDPMYPPRTKSAQVKKEMRALQTVVGRADDGADLLRMALRAAKQRVVVKRPAWAESLLPTTAPTVVFATKKHRFDVYVIAALNS
jgi:16S rRNA (guanine1516-N2)-methyltransferase